MIPETNNLSALESAQPDATGTIQVEAQDAAQSADLMTMNVTKRPLPDLIQDLNNLIPDLNDLRNRGLWHRFEQSGGVLLTNTVGLIEVITARLDEAGAALARTVVPLMKAAQGDPAILSFLTAVAAEIVRARSKFPDPILTTVALGEEFGELCRALMDEPSADVVKEAVQLACMAGRVAIEGDRSIDPVREANELDAHPPRP